MDQSACPQCMCPLTPPHMTPHPTQERLGDLRPGSSIHGKGQTCHSRVTCVFVCHQRVQLERPPPRMASLLTVEESS